MIKTGDPAFSLLSAMSVTGVDPGMVPLAQEQMCLLGVRPRLVSSPAPVLYPEGAAADAAPSDVKNSRLGRCC